MHGHCLCNLLFFLHKPPILHTMLYHAGPIATHQPHQATLFTSQYYTYNTYHTYKQHNTIHTARYTLLSYEQPLNVIVNVYH